MHIVQVRFNYGRKGWLPSLQKKITKGRLRRSNVGQNLEIHLTIEATIQRQFSTHVDI